MCRTQNTHFSWKHWLGLLRASATCPRVWNISEPAGKMLSQTFAQICLLSRAGNLNRCLQWAAILMKMLCQDANKKNPIAFLLCLQNVCSRAAQEWKPLVYYLTLLVEEGSVFPLPGPSRTPHCLPLTAHFPKCRHTTPLQGEAWADAIAANSRDCLIFSM